MNFATNILDVTISNLTVMRNRLSPIEKDSKKPNQNNNKMYVAAFTIACVAGALYFGVQGALAVVFGSAIGAVFKGAAAVLCYDGAIWLNNYAKSQEEGEEGADSKVNWVKQFAQNLKNGLGGQYTNGCLLKGVYIFILDKVATRANEKAIKKATA